MLSEEGSEGARARLAHLVSFVGHDIYGPVAMLRTYLRAVGDTSQNASDLREMMSDAERLAEQVEGMVRILQDRLRLESDRLELKPQPLDLGSFVQRFVEKNALVKMAAPLPSGLPTLQLDAGVLARALEDAAFQLSRLGDQQGEIAVAVESASGEVRLCLWRADGDLDFAVLHRMVTLPDADWETDLRRQPACGLPLRVAVSLTEAQGGRVLVENENDRGYCRLLLAFRAGKLRDHEE